MPESPLFTPAEHAFLEDLQRRSFQYFIDQAHPRTGLVRDRARASADAEQSNAPGSVAADGFALSGWVIADSRGWVTRDTALQHVRRMLLFLAEKAAHKNGFFYHFLKPATGEREWACEVSSIDTALLLSGALVAREYFQDPEITRLVNTIYHRVDWRWFLNSGQTLSIGWKPESGFSRWRWDNYSEHMVMNLLGIGAPDAARALSPAQWHAWRREPLGAYAGFRYLQNPALFIHQFSQAYFDFRATRDAYADYFLNSHLATLAQRQWCIDLANEFPKWGPNMWGLTASDGPGNYYGAWGGPPRTKNKHAINGTLVPCAPAGSLPFAPRQTIGALVTMRNDYGDRIWGRYGFADAFNPQTGWVSHDVIGIDVGITLIQAENARTGLIWALFMRAPEIRRAAALAGFHSTVRNLPDEDTAYLRALAAAYWKNISATNPDAPEKTRQRLGAPASSRHTAQSAAPSTDHAGKMPALPGSQASPADSDPSLRLTAIAAARALDLIDEQTAISQIRAQLRSTPNAELQTPNSCISARAQLAAAYITLRNAFPALASELTPRLNALKWADRPLADTPQPLGTPSRLATFIAIALDKAPVVAWEKAHTREIESRSRVTFLAPGWAGGLDAQLLPGLWLDERAVLSGASARQLAYSQIEYARRHRLPAWGWSALPAADITNGDTKKHPASPHVLALALEIFPPETVAALRALIPNPDAGASLATPSENKPGVASNAPAATTALAPDIPHSEIRNPHSTSAAALVALANFINRDCIRNWFQADPLVKRARERIPEFAEAPFGHQTSVIAQRELSPVMPPPPPRRAVARAAGIDPKTWDWHDINGLEFRDFASSADILPTDPPLGLRFSFTWDDQNLYFHGEVEDTIVKNDFPPERIYDGDAVELFISPDNTPLIWGHDSYLQFEYAIGDKGWESFHARPAPVKVTRTQIGYNIEAAIPWKQLRLKPRAGLELGVSPALHSAETTEQDPAVKLNWRFHRLPSNRYELGTLQLE